MKVRDSGMPDEAVWEEFFDAAQVLAALDVIDPSGDVVDFGCGYGTFSVAAARRTRGTVFALDIDPQMIAATRAKARALGVTNITAIERDFVTSGSGLPDATAAAALLFNILHADEPLALLKEAHRVLAPGGKVGVVHWIPDATTPRGPSLEIRPRPEQCQAWLLEAGFELVRPAVALPPYHYGLVGLRPAHVVMPMTQDVQ
jgi:SAM-dependent methyltransferase